MSEANQDLLALLQQCADQTRISAVTMTNHVNLGHTGGDLSASDILTCLYLGGVLQIDPENPTWPQRDRFIMSKGIVQELSTPRWLRAAFFQSSNSRPS